jgi:hypothetical protein
LMSPPDPGNRSRRTRLPREASAGTS